MKRFELLCLARWTVAVGLVLFCACSNQGEGQRCSRLSGNNGADDCNAGLSCQRIGELEICCPVPGVAPTVLECMVGPTVQADAGGEGGQVDAAVDAVTEAGPLDAGSDAIVEATDGRGGNELDAANDAVDADSAVE